MKIVYINYLGIISGVSIGPSVHIREFVSAMIKKGHQVIVFPPLRYSEYKGSPKINLLIRYGKQFKNILFNIKHFQREMKVIREEKPDIILNRYSLYCFSSFIISKLYKIPLVLEVNAPMAFEMRKYLKEYYYLPFFPDLSEKIMLKLADAVIVVSDELRRYFMELGLNGDRIYVIANGVDIDKFKYKKKNKQVMNKYGLQSNQVVVGFIGSFNHWHGLDLLLDSFVNVVNIKKNVKFLLIGDGFNREVLEKSVAKRNIDHHVVFTGLIPHDAIPDYLSVMDIVLAPYPDLDFFYFSPLKLFEYMAALKPVIATRVGQVKSIIKDGENGYLFNTDDISQFEKKLIVLIEDKKLRNKIGKEARKTILSDYTWEICAGKTERICKDQITRSK